MKVIGGIACIIGYIFGTIVSYHVTMAAAPDYMGFWVTSLILVTIGVILQVAGEMAGE